MSERERVYVFDTTLRDGNQAQGVDFSVSDKRAIAVALDDLGVDYIEGGWPGANPTDDSFFGTPPALKKASLTAFGMTRRPGRSVANDPGLSAVLGAEAPAFCLVGKSWDHQVRIALGIEPEENLDMIADSIREGRSRGKEAMYDAEHFFDGYKANPDYAVKCLETALEAGARWAVLCDTNGGTLPHEVAEIVSAVTARLPGDRIGIHTHNDTENAVANTLAAVDAGVRQVQGTLNGVGERCGNANLVSIIPTLMLKPGFRERFELGIPEENLIKLRRVSRILDELLNRAPNRHQPYVGDSAFAHKGGLHVSAVEKDPSCYEHIDPAMVGNRRHILVSDQAGRSNILARFREIGLEIDPKNPKVESLVAEVKRQEFDGYAYDGAEASFELLARRTLEGLPDFFTIQRFRVMDERRYNARGELITESEATVSISVGNEMHHEVAVGNGPVNALDTALRKALLAAYPILEGVELEDFKVRILTPRGTNAVTRVMIQSRDHEGNSWGTVGVSTNIIDASMRALNDSLTYKLIREREVAA